MVRRRAGTQAGFVISLELILIITILGIGTLAGIIAIRNALIKWLGNKQAQTVWVYDSAGIVLGPARDFDEHEAPRLFYIDRELSDDENLPEEANPDPDWIGKNFRAFIGVRDDRLTTRHRIFYTDSLDCGRTVLLGGTVRACITGASREDQDNLGVGTVSLTIDGVTTGMDTFFISQTLPINEAGGQGYLYPLQDGPTYGVGRDAAAAVALPSGNPIGLPGTLYRQTADACTEETLQIRSVWTSQTVRSGEPCVPLPEGILVTSAKCPDGQQGLTLGGQCNIPPSGNVDQRCVTAGTCSISNTGCSTNDECPAGETCDTGTLQCACPQTADGIFENNWFEVGANCCPPGTTSTTQAGQCVIGGEGLLFEATRVQLGGVNVFSTLTPPFHVNLPPDPNSLVLTAPTGVEGGGPGTPIGPYEAPDFQFAGTPDDEGP